LSLFRFKKRAWTALVLEELVVRFSYNNTLLQCFLTLPLTYLLPDPVASWELPCS